MSLSYMCIQMVMNTVDSGCLFSFCFYFFWGGACFQWYFFLRATAHSFKKYFFIWVGGINVTEAGNVISARLRCKACFPLAIYYRISMEPPVNPGLAKQFYHLSVMEAPERTFWPTQQKYYPEKGWEIKQRWNRTIIYCPATMCWAY